MTAKHEKDIVSLNHSAARLLGLECGGTRSVAILADTEGRLIRRTEADGSNLRLLTNAQLLDRFRAIASRFQKPAAIGIGMSGVREEEDRRRVRRAAAVAWPEVPCIAANDLETAFAAAPQPVHSNVAARVLIVSGTGSCCYGRNHAGATASIGGWGHVLGDQGSGYDIGLRALKAALAHYDHTGIWPALGQCLLRAAQLNSPNSLVDWAQSASKAEIASLAVDVFKAQMAGDKIAGKVVAAALTELADDAIACAERLVRRPKSVQFVATGSVLLRQPQICQSLARKLRKNWGKSEVCQLKREGAWGAIELAKQALVVNTGHSKMHENHRVLALRRGFAENSSRFICVSVPKSVRPAPTEERNPASRNLDRLPIERAIELMLWADESIPVLLREKKRQIAQAIRIISQAFKQGGRLFYVGAGTSGRLGALDASECPPTFGVSPDLVQAIIAGGRRALWNSMEDLEDDLMAGADAVQFRGVTAKDVVVGIAASGRTPFVWGALATAKERGARTILVCFNPHLNISISIRPRVVVAPNLGPEVLTGSTRLRAGTATKMILNMFSTLAMVRLGKVVSNLMVDLNPANSKLRDRAVRIVRELSGASEVESRRVLESCDWRVKAALATLDQAYPAKKRITQNEIYKRRPL